MKPKHRHACALVSISTLCILLSTAGAVLHAGDPPAHVKGRALELARAQAVEAARIAATAGAGFEAASILASVIEQAPKSDAAREARNLLDDWELGELPLDRLSPQDVALRVRRSAEAEESALRACAHAKVLLALGRSDLAAEALAALPFAEARGAAKRKIHELFTSLGLEAAERESAFGLARAELAGRLERGREAIRLTRLKRFLVEADPDAGKVFSSVLGAVLPETRTLKMEEDRGFIAMPGMAFGGGGRGFRGGPGGFGGPGGPGGFGGGGRGGGGFGGGGGRGGPGPGFGGPGGGRGGFDVAPMIRGFEDQIRGRGTAQAPPEAAVEPVVPLASPPECLAVVSALEARDPGAALDLARLAVKAHGSDPAAGGLREALSRLESSSRGSASPREPGEPSSNGATDLSDLHFDLEAVHEYEILISEASLSDLKRDPKAYVAATFKVPGDVFEGVDLRLKGSVGTFQPIDGLTKPGFTVKLNARIEGQKLDGLRKIILANGIQSAGGLGEWLAYSLFREAGLQAPRITFANVAVNGEPYGMYVEAEAVTRRALKAWFGDGSGDLYEGPGDVTRWDDLDADTNEETADRERLKALSEAAEAAEKDGSLDPLRDLVHLPELARFAALETILAHWDGYLSTNNYRLYLDPLTQRFSLIPHGADQVLGSTRTDVLAPGRGVLSRAFLACKEGRELYEAELRSLLDRVFVPSRLLPRLLSGYLRVHPHILADSRSPLGAIETLRRIEGLASRIEERRRFIDWQLAGQKDKDLGERIQRLARPASPFGFFGR